MAKIPGRVSPLVDVCVPFAGKDLSQTKLVRAVIFLVGLVPRRPEYQRQRAVPPNDIEIVGRKILFSPVARRNDDGLMFSHHLLEILDRFERHVVLRIAKIHERARVSAVIRNHDLDRAVRIDSRNAAVRHACRRDSSRDECYFKTLGAHKLGLHSGSSICCELTRRNIRVILSEVEESRINLSPAD
jgi:hypothetical protein